jgi:hypothetical protein
MGQEEEDNIDDRVFVCLGKTRQGSKHAWVLTIDKEFSQVTLWEPTTAVSYVLPGRISNKKFLKEYLVNRELSESEKKEVLKHQNLKR